VKIRGLSPIVRNGAGWLPALLLSFWMISALEVKGQVTEEDLNDRYIEAYDAKDYRSALGAAVQLNLTLKESLGDSSLELSRSWVRMGDCYQKLSLYDSSVDSYLKGKALLEAQERSTVPMYVKLLFNLGLSEYFRNQIPEAIEVWELHRKGLALLSGTETKEYFNISNNLGALKTQLGQFQEAESDYKVSQELALTLWGTQSKAYAHLALNFGGLKYSLGDWEGAERLWKETMAYYTLQPQPDSQEIRYKVYKNLGNVYRDWREFKKSETFYLQSLEIAKSLYDSQHVELALLYNNLGRMQFEVGQLDQAEFNLSKAFQILSLDSSQKRDYGMCLYNLGELAETKRTWKTADTLYRKVLDIRLRSYGSVHPYTQEVEVQLAGVALEMNQTEAAYAALNRILKVKSKEVSDNFEWLDEMQQESYWKSEVRFYDKLLWNAQTCHQTYPLFSGLAYNVALQTKSRLLESKVSSEDFYQEVEELRDSLKFYRRKLARMESEGNENSTQLNMIRTKASKFDKELQLRNEAYARQKEQLQITWEQVRQELDTGELAVEFLRIYNPLDSAYAYHALVLGRSFPTPLWVMLCREKDITGLKPEFSYGIYHRLLWKPLQSYLKGIRTIYYAPVGDLSNVPFNALYEDQGGDLAYGTDSRVRRGRMQKSRFLITNYQVEYLMDRYAMRQLTSTRYLAIGLKTRTQKPLESSIALFGGAQFNHLPQTVLRNAAEDLDPEALAQEPDALPYLPGTYQEVQEIEGLLGSKSWKVTKNASDSATEERFKTLDGPQAPSVIHVSTHGFAFPQVNSHSDQVTKVNSLQYIFRNHRNPLVRSGLVLSGGNWAWMGKDVLAESGEFENGILTALEVSQMKLRKTRLVVLSACQTGLGAVEGSEGTFGLKRAFKMSGVEQMLVTLWEVPDKETKELMGHFYTQLALSKNPVKAIEAAQKTMRNQYPTRPDLWGAFVLIY